MGKFCIQCGSQNNENSKFCANCGNKLDEETIQKQEWSIEKHLQENPPNERGIVICPYCLGKGEIDNDDIDRVFPHELSLGNCEFCDSVGKVNLKKLSAPKTIQQENKLQDIKTEIDEPIKYEVFENSNIQKTEPKLNTFSWIMIGIYLISISASFIFSSINS